MSCSELKEEWTGKLSKKNKEQCVDVNRECYSGNIGSESTSGTEERREVKKQEARGREAKAEGGKRKEEARK